MRSHRISAVKGLPLTITPLRYIGRRIRVVNAVLYEYSGLSRPGALRSPTTLAR